MVSQPPAVIAGSMPRVLRYSHTLGLAFMCVILVTFGLFVTGFLFPAGSPGPGPIVPGSGLVMVAVPALVVGTQLWFSHRLVSEFSFDGRLLRFRTLGLAQTQTRDVFEIAELSDWRGRGASLGYRLRFRDGAKIFLQYRVSNASAVATQLRQNLTK